MRRLQLPWRTRLLRRPVRSLLLALGLLLLALAMPRWNLGRDAWQTIVVFDITQSMNVEDERIGGANVSRLDFARAAARQVLRELPCGTRVGWAAFAEYRTLLLVAPVEVCEHYNDLIASLGNVDGRMRWANASEIAKGVFWAVRTAVEEGSHADVVFVTDGHEAPALHGDGPAPFEEARGGQIHGWILGVGGDVPRPIPKTDEDGHRIGYWRADEVPQVASDAPEDAPPGNEHLSAVHEAHLKVVAREVGFDYARLDGPDALRRAIADPRHARRVRVATDLAWLPASLALLILLVRLRPDVHPWVPARRAWAAWRQRRAQRALLG